MNAKETALVHRSQRVGKTENEVVRSNRRREGSKFLEEGRRNKRDPIEEHSLEKLPVGST